MVSWTGRRIQALSLHRKVGSDSWLPTRGLFSRENFPFLVAYAWTLQQVRTTAQTVSYRTHAPQTVPHHTYSASDRGPSFFLVQRCLMHMVLMANAHAVLSRAGDRGIFLQDWEAMDSTTAAGTFSVEHTTRDRTYAWMVLNRSEHVNCTSRLHRFTAK